MHRVISVLCILIASGCVITEQWKFSSGEVRNFTLSNTLEEGDYDIYPCSSYLADGSLEDKKGTRYNFCVGTGIENRVGELKITKTETSLCLWRETGYCDKGGMCASFSLLDDCSIQHP